MYTVVILSIIILSEQWFYTNNKLYHLLLIETVSVFKILNCGFLFNIGPAGSAGPVPSPLIIYATFVTAV